MVFTAEEEGDGLLLPELYGGGGPGLGIDDSGHGSTTGLDMDLWAAEPLTADLLDEHGSTFMETMTAYLEGQSNHGEEADEGARSGMDDGGRRGKVATTTRRASQRQVIKKEPGGPTSSALGGAMLGGTSGSGLSTSLGSVRGLGRTKGPALMQHSCEACKLSKKKCNRQNPCQVCLFRGIPCIPQDRGPGRPPGSRTRQASSSSSFGSRGSNLSDLANADLDSNPPSASMNRLRSSCSTSALGGHSPRPLHMGHNGASISTRGPHHLTTSHHSQHGGHGSHHHSHAPVSGSSSSAYSNSGPPLPLSTSSPALINQHHYSHSGQGGAHIPHQQPPQQPPRLSRQALEALHHLKGSLMQVWGEGDLSLAKCLEMRNFWRRLNQRFSVDVSVGLCEQVDAALGHVPSQPSSAAPYSSSSSSSDGQIGGGGSLRHPANATNPDPSSSEPQGGAAVYHCLPDFLRKLDDGISLLVGFLHSRDEFYAFANERFANTFMPAEDLAAGFENHGVIPDLLLAQIFDREDLAEVYGALGRFWFGGADPETEEMAVHVKCTDRNGERVLCLVRYRMHLSKPDGYPAASILSIRPFPTPCKYLRYDPSYLDLSGHGTVTSNIVDLSGHGTVTGSVDGMHAPPSSVAGTSPPLSQRSISSSSLTHAPNQHQMHPPQQQPPPQPAGSRPDDAHFQPLRRGLSVLTDHAQPMRIPSTVTHMSSSPDNSMHGGEAAPPRPLPHGGAQTYNPGGAHHGFHHHNSHHHNHHGQSHSHRPPHTGAQASQGGHHGGSGNHGGMGGHNHNHNQQGQGNGQGQQQQAFALLTRQYASAPPVPGMHFPGSANADFNPTHTGHNHPNNGQNQNQGGPFPPHATQPPQQPPSHAPHTNGDAPSSFHGPSGTQQQQQGHDRSLMDEAFYQGAGALFFKASAEEDLPEDLRHDEIFSDHEEEEDDSGSHPHMGGSDMVVEEEALMMGGHTHAHGHTHHHHSQWAHQHQGGGQQRGGGAMTGMDG